MKRPRTLTAAFVRSVTRPGRYGDGRGGHGLSLLVKPMTSTGRTSRSWSQRLRIQGQVRTLGLGAYPAVTLAEARRRAVHNAREAAEGRDPRRGRTPTLRTATEKVIAVHSVNWKTDRTAKQWRSAFERYVYPKLGDKPVDKITTADVLAVLVPMLDNTPDLARRLRGLLSKVFRWSVGEGWRPDDPAGEPAKAALPKNGHKAKNYRAIPHAEIAETIRKLRQVPAGPSIRLALEFMALTAARAVEVRGARWSEIDTETATWTIPADRMKAGQEHRIPLSAEALDVLDRAAQYTDRDGLIFPGRTGGEIGRATVVRTFAKTGANGTPHGLRSTFRDWCGETGVAREVAEACLAHQVGNAVELAYARSDLLERRREVMEAWGRYAGV